MGIKDNEKDIPVCDDMQDVELEDENDFPVVYSDSSDDTDTRSVISFDNNSHCDDEFCDENSFNYDTNSSSLIEFSQLEYEIQSLDYVETNEPEKEVYAVSNNLTENDDSTNFFEKQHNFPNKKISRMGRRKARRYENARQLYLLWNEAFSNEIDIDDLMPFSAWFRFSKILEDKDLTKEILDCASIEDDHPIRPNVLVSPNNKRKHSSQ